MIRFTRRARGAYTVYAEPMGAVAVVVLVNNQWHGVTTDGAFTAHGTSRKIVAESLAERYLSERAVSDQ